MDEPQFINKPPYWINRAAFAFRTELQHAFSRHGIDVTPEEWGLQMVLFEEETLTVGQLASLTLRDRTTVTRCLEALEHKKLIVREVDPRDRRRTLVRMSRKGNELFPRMLTHVEELIARGTRGIGVDEIAGMHSVLARIIVNLSEDEPRDSESS